MPYEHESLTWLLRTRRRIDDATDARDVQYAGLPFNLAPNVPRATAVNRTGLVGGPIR
jgi:hypothetical protein